MHPGIPSLDLMYVRPKCVHTKCNSHQNHRSDHSPPLHPFPPKKTTRRGAIQCTPTRTVITFKVAPHFSSSTTDAGAVGLMWNFQPLVCSLVMGCLSTLREVWRYGFLKVFNSKKMSFLGCWHLDPLDCFHNARRSTKSVFKYRRKSWCSLICTSGSITVHIIVLSYLYKTLIQ